ncbi:hypothetical protein ACFV0W_40000, partial [Streptomyces anulatus]
MCSALLLILRVVLHNQLALWLVGAMALWFLACWFVFPVWALARGRSGRRAEEHEGEDSDGDAPPDRGSDAA